MGTMRGANMRVRHRTRLAFLVTTVVLLAVSLAAGASHGSPASLPATSASGDWSNPNAVFTDNSQFASSSADGDVLDIGSFASSGLVGPISSVDLLIDHTQQAHSNDRLDVSASVSGCGGVTASPGDFEASGTRTDRIVSLSCANGWSWARVAGVQVKITTQAVDDGVLDLNPVDGEWRIYYVELRVHYSNQAPTAEAGADQTAQESTTVALDGAASADPEGSTLSFSWAQVEGPAVALDGSTTARPSFRAPTLSSNAPQALRFELTVEDPQGHVDTDEVRVTVENVNQAPVADAGDDRTVPAGVSVTLDGTGSSDPDGDTLSYAWSQTSGPVVAFDDPETARPTFTAPASAGQLVFDLVVTDTRGESSSPDTITVAVTEASPSPTSPPSPEPGASPTTPPAGGVQEVLLDPVVVEVQPLGSASVRMQVRFADGSLVVPDGGCTWDAGSAGGSVDVAGDACQATFTAGSAIGADYELRVQWEEPEAGTWTAQAEVSIGFVAVPGDGPAGSCVVRVAGMDGTAVPVLFGPSCPAGLRQVVLTMPAGGPPAVVEASPMTEPPSGLPVDDASRVRAYDIQVRDDAGTPLQPETVAVTFDVDDAAYAQACPDGGCGVEVFHHDGDAWRALDVEETAGADGRVLRATADTVSPFAVVVMPPSAAGFPWWLLVVGVGVLAGAGGAAAWYVRRRDQGPEATPVDDPEAPVAGNLLDELRNEELLQFLNNAAHDLASPLTPIKLQLAILERTEGETMTEGQRKALGVVARNIEHMGMLVGDLREASRIQAGKFQVFPEPIDLVGLVEDAQASFAEPAAEEGVTLDAKVTAGSLPAMADRGRMTQVFYNLVNNAIKFTPEGGRVRIEAHRRGGEALLLVRDTGLGLSAEDVDRLFKPFSQVHGAKEKKKGSGLGLYICKGIVEEHGGRIWCESPGPGKGTSFLFTVPLRAAEGSGVSSRVAALRARGGDGGSEP